MELWILRSSNRIQFKTKNFRGILSSRGNMNSSSCCFPIPWAQLALCDGKNDGKHPSATRTYYDYSPISPRTPTNKMAVDGPRPAESLRHLACSLAALDPAPWEKVRIIDQWKIFSIYSLDWIAVICMITTNFDFACGSMYY